MKNANASSMSIRARINNFAIDNGISPQHALQAYFAERFLARIEKSRYAKNLAVKGGTLMSSILGVALRTTMDIDATIIGLRVDDNLVKKIVAEVAAVDAGDGIVFDVGEGGLSTIRKDDDYGGYSISVHALLGTIRLPLGIDLTFGDIITPRAEARQFSTILDNEVKVTVLAYTVETLIAEKLQTILHRGTANTRPRDFYDLHMLFERGEFDWRVLGSAVRNTFVNRHSEEYLAGWKDIISAIATSEKMSNEWNRYRKSATYASGLVFEDVVGSVAKTLERLTK